MSNQEPKPKRKVTHKSFGINDLLNAKFKYVELDEPWQKHLGKIEKNTTILIKGPAKNGKTDYCIKLTKQLAKKGLRIYYNSYEEGKSATLQEAAIRNDLQEVAGRVSFGNKTPFEVVLKRMTGPGSPSCVLIDSWDYMKLTAAQFIAMRNQLRYKLIIIVCWADGTRPDDGEAKKIEHMAGVLVSVRNYCAKSVSRYGGNQKMNFIDQQLQFTNGQLFS
jgi:predicted ATP-dependent serine protease